MPTDNKTTIIKLTHNALVQLTPMNGLDEGYYQLSPKHVGAIQAAYLCQRPLLVRGGPGLGKSQLAHAVASILGWGLVSVAVHHDTSVEELLYGIDHVQRLDEANRPGAEVKPIGDYIRPGKLWQTIAPGTLKQHNMGKPHEQDGTVLLIDEIDKAEPSLPNALLEVLAERAISVPYLNEKIVADANHPHFVLITSNEERLLPQAFLRRCVTLDLQLPADKDAAIQWLMAVFKTHYPDKKQQNEYHDLALAIAQKVIDHRQRVTADNSGDYLSGTAEFLDTLKTLVAFDAAERLAKLELLTEHLISKSQFGAG